MNLTQRFEHKKTIQRLESEAIEIDKSIRDYIDDNLIDTKYREVANIVNDDELKLEPNFVGRPNIDRVTKEDMSGWINDQKNGGEVQLFKEAPGRYVVFDEHLKRWNNYFMKVELIKLTDRNVEVSCNVRDLSMAEGYGGTEIGNRTYRFNIDREMLENNLTKNIDNE